MPFTSAGGNLKSIFITEYEIIDRYVGNQLWIWGYNARGQLGINSLVNRSSPVQTVSGGTNWKQVASTGGMNAAVKCDGSLWVWGRGTSGQLGVNIASAYRSSPVQTVSGGTNWRQVCVGTSVVTATKTDGTLWLWGFNSAGQLGNNATLDRSSPVQTVSGGTNWKTAASRGNSNAGGIKTNGQLWIWGCGGSGALGNNSTVNQSSPIQTVAGGNNWQQLSIETNNMAAIKTDNTLWLWGLGFNGKLGNNSTINQSSPVQTVSGGTNWKQVSMGSSSVSAIKTNGTLWSWGAGTGGQLGNNSTLAQSSPVQTVSGGTNWKQAVSATANTHLGIKTDGTLWLWGCNGYGRLGTNNTVSQSSPVQTVSGGTNWKLGDISDSVTVITFTES